MASVSENSILTILKATKVSLTAGTDNLFGHFLDDGVKFLSLRDFSITYEMFPVSCRVAIHKPLCKKGSLTQPSVLELQTYIFVTLDSHKKGDLRTNNSPNYLLLWIQKTYSTLINLIFEKDFCLSYLND